MKNSDQIEHDEHAVTEPMAPQESLTRFVVAGCSRSGTTYTAKLMSALGYPCGHERIFNIWRIYGIGGLSDPMTNFFESDSKQGDASFLSIPYLDRLPEGTVVLHQVRNPLAVIRSHMGMHFFSDPYIPSIYLANEHPQILDFLRSHCPEILAAETEIGRCMRYWYLWNQMAQSAENNPGLIYLRYRIEDLDLSMLRRIVELLARDFDEQRSINALESLRTDTNTRPRDTSWSWDNLPAGQDKDRIIELSRSYNYRNQ